MKVRSGIALTGEKVRLKRCLKANTFQVHYKKRNSGEIPFSIRIHRDGEQLLWYGQTRLYRLDQELYDLLQIQVLRATLAGENTIYLYV